MPKKASSVLAHPPEPLDDDIPAVEGMSAEPTGGGLSDISPADELLSLVDSDVEGFSGDDAAAIEEEPSFQPDSPAGASAAPASVPVPDFTSRTTISYAMASTDFDQRPAYALVRAMRGQSAVSQQLAESARTIERATADVLEVQGFAERGRDLLSAWVFGGGGLVEQLKTIFGTERDLNRAAAKGGLLDAADEVEKLVERYGNAKRAEFDAHAIQKAAELEREMHRITVSSLQTALQAIVEEKTVLATQKAEYEARNRYATRMGIAYGVAGLCGGAALALAAVLMR
jgi:hypothetical protein